MGAINTRTVGPAVIQLWPGQAGAPDCQVINLDTEQTVYLGSTVSITTSDGTALPLGPLASAAFAASQPLYAVATQQMRVGLVPGGSNYSPGALTINGPVTATITGPVEIEGTVDVAGTVEIGGTPTVDLAPGTTVEIDGDVTIGGMPTVALEAGSTVAISGTADVSISGTPTVELEAGSTVAISGTADVSISGTPTVELMSGSTVAISGTPTVDLAAGATVDIGGTATVNVANASIDVLSTAQVAIQLLGPTTLVHPGSTLGLVGTFTMPATAAGYQLAVNPTGVALNTFYVADVSVNQFDAAGNVLASDTFTVSNFQNPAQAAGGASVVIRGPVLGTTIQVEMGVAGAAFLNTLFGLSTLAPAVQGNMYALPVYDGGPSYVYMSPSNRVLVIAENTTVSATPVNFAAVQCYTGPASVNIYNKGTTSQVAQGVIQSYTVLGGPTSPQTTWFSDFIAGQSAHSAAIYVNNMFQICTLLLRAGTGTCTVDMGINSA